MSDNISGENTKGILLFCNRKYIFALGTFLLNIQKYINYDGVVVYHEGFTEAEQAAIRKIEPRIKLIDYRLDDFAAEFGFAKEELKSYTFIQRYSVLNIIKFKVFQHLKDFATIIIFDLDMVLLGGADDLLEKTFDIAWRKDLGTISGKLRWWKIEDELFQKIGMQEIYSKALTPNGGFIVVKRNFDYQGVYEECVRYLQNFVFLHPQAIDEIIFGYVTEKCKLNLYNVDPKVYNVTLHDVSMSSKLVHFMGNYKPWNNRTVQAIFREWWINYEKYVKLTGMPSEDVLDFSNISECVLQARYREKWDDLFQKYHFTYPKALEMKPKFDTNILTFSYYGMSYYSIETEWLKPVYYCIFSLDKNNNVPVEKWRRKLRDLAAGNSDFITYHESGDMFVLKTLDKAPWDIPATFYRLYEMTKEFRNTTITSWNKIITYHGTKLYVDLKNACLKHAANAQMAEVLAEVNGNRIALFINIGGMSIFLKDIDKNGRITMGSQQTFFLCKYNTDHSISIVIEDGRILSADGKGEIVLRHWNREWEHFYLKMLGNIIE